MEETDGSLRSMVQPPPPGSNWWRIPVAILTVSAVAVVAILLSKQQRGAPDPATAVTWEAACPGDLSGDFKCFERHYQTVVNSQSVEAAFTDIKDAWSPYARSSTTSWSMSSGGPRVTCSATSRRHMGRGTSSCWSGYYHGVMGNPRQDRLPERQDPAQHDLRRCRRDRKVLVRSLQLRPRPRPWRHAREPARTLRRADDM